MQNNLKMTRFYRQLYQSPLGPLSIVVDEESLVGIWFCDQANCEQGLEHIEAACQPLHGAVFEWLDRYFIGENPFMPFPLSPQGTDFQQRVWAYLAQIPYGGKSDLWRDCPGLVLQIGPSHRSSSRSESLDPPHPMSPSAGDGEKVDWLCCWTRSQTLAVAS